MEVSPGGDRPVVVLWRVSHVGSPLKGIPCIGSMEATSGGGSLDGFPWRGSHAWVPGVILWRGSTRGCPVVGFPQEGVRGGVPWMGPRRRSPFGLPRRSHGGVLWRGSTVGVSLEVVPCRGSPGRGHMLGFPEW
jgi:hypothetical protein